MFVRSHLFYLTYFHGILIFNHNNNNVISQSFGAGAKLQRCFVTRHLVSPRTYGLMICTFGIILILKLPREHIYQG